MAMGLLSEYPHMSPTFRKFTARTTRKPHYTDRNKMHMVALYWTPELSRNWIRYQFEQAGMDGPWAMKNLRKYAYNHENRRRWEHLGQQNILFIGQPEVQRYFERRKTYTRIPSWAIPIFNDHRKQGMSLQAIADKYGIDRPKMTAAMRRSMFEPVIMQKHHNEKWKNRSNKS